MIAGKTLRYLVLNSSKSKTRLKFLKLGLLSLSGINMPWYFFVPFGAGFSICFSQTRASHNKRDGFGKDGATFGDETISVASYCFPKISSVNIEQQECCVQFWKFSRFVWTFLYTNWVFQAFCVHNSNLNYMRMLQCIEIR